MACWKSTSRIPICWNGFFLIHALGIIAFCIGLLQTTTSLRADSSDLLSMRSTIQLDETTRARFCSAAIWLGVISALVMWSMIYMSGGVGKLLAIRKPFLQSPINSGYYEELVKLGYLSMILLAFSWQSQWINLQRILGFLFVGQAPILEATVCGRARCFGLGAGDLRRLLVYRSQPAT